MEKGYFFDAAATAAPLDTPRPQTTLRRMITASFKITGEQMGDLRERAHARRMTLSDYLRALVFPERKPRRAKIVPKRHPVSGFWYNAAPPPRTPTQAELDEALKDYL